MVLILLSSFIQTMYFKATRKITGTGKRVFLRAPLHHHFEELGWTETKIVERFFIVSILFSGLALVLLKFEKKIPGYPGFLIKIFYAVYFLKKDDIIPVKCLKERKKAS